MDSGLNKCAKCNSEASYSEKYDARYCEQCNEWLEDICNDRSCSFCQTRPLKPVNETHS